MFFPPASLGISMAEFRRPRRSQLVCAWKANLKLGQRKGCKGAQPTWPLQSLLLTLADFAIGDKEHCEASWDVAGS